MNCFDKLYNNNKHIGFIIITEYYNDEYYFLFNDNTTIGVVNQYDKVKDDYDVLYNLVWNDYYCTYEMEYYREQLAQFILENLKKSIELSERGIIDLYIKINEKYYKVDTQNIVNLVTNK